MDSKTKNRLSSIQIKQLVKRHFPLETVSVIRELHQGFFNAVYLIHGSGILRSGIILKVGPTPIAPILSYEKNIMAGELEAYSLLRDKNLPLSDILATDFTHQDILADYFFMRRIDGVIYKSIRRHVSAIERKNLLGEVGDTLRTIHSVHASWFGYLAASESERYSSWGEAFRQMIKNILSDGKKWNCNLPYEDIWRTVNGYLPLLNAVRTPVLVDFDLWAGNIFVDRKNYGHIVGIIDLERAFYGDPLADFAALSLVADHPEEEPTLWRHYMPEQKKKFLTPDDLRRLNLYRLYMTIIMYVEAYRYKAVYSTAVRFYMKARIRDLLIQLN